MFDIEKNISTLKKLKDCQFNHIKFILETFINGIGNEQFHYSSDDIENLIRTLTTTCKNVAKYEGAIDEYEAIATGQFE